MVDYTRIDKITKTDKAKQKASYYSDFYTNFNANPFNKKLARYTNEEAVRRAIKNIVLTNKNERLFQPEFGSAVESLLFEPMDDISAQRIKDAIGSSIEKYEKRARVISIDVIPNDLKNAYEVFIYFEVINSDKPQSITLTLYRVR